jgi:adenylosuccinate synthase
VLQGQLELDASSEKKLGSKFIGTTKRGIGPTYATKMFRYGVRAGELKNWDVFLQKYNAFNQKIKDDYHITVDHEKELNELKQYRDLMVSRNMIIDSATYINDAIKNGKIVLAEGANAIMLDIDHGTYPYVTASNTGVGGVVTGLGIPPRKIETTIGIVKAYTTRVGEGAFPTELKDKIGEYIQKKGHEFGATTGRPRRCGWLDVPLLRYSNMLNDYSSINITKLDIFDDLDEIKIGVEYRIKGKKIEYMPAQIEELGQVEVVYETVKG